MFTDYSFAVCRDHHNCRKQEALPLDLTVTLESRTGVKLTCLYVGHCCCPITQTIFLHRCIIAATNEALLQGDCEEGEGGGGGRVLVATL